MAYAPRVCAACRGKLRSDLGDDCLSRVLVDNLGSRAVNCTCFDQARTARRGAYRRETQPRWRRRRRARHVAGPTARPRRGAPAGRRRGPRLPGPLALPVRQDSGRGRRVGTLAPSDSRAARRARVAQEGAIQRAGDRLGAERVAPAGQPYASVSRAGRDGAPLPFTGRRSARASAKRPYRSGRDAIRFRFSDRIWIFGAKSA